MRELCTAGRRALAAACILLCTTAGGIAADPALTLAATTDDALVLLAVRLGQSQLSDALPAQEFNGELYLPLGGLAALLGIGIESAASRATASGFILDPERSFYLDARAGTVAIAGVTENFDVQDIRMGADDIYVARRLISAWLPVDLEVDMPSLWLLVHPREPLPLQTLAQRERRAGSLPDPHAQAGPTLTHRATPYTWAQFPTVDQTLAFETTASGGEFRSAARLTTFATADLLQLEGAAFLTAASGRVPTSARLTLARHDPDNGLLGFLHANSISFGSVPMAGVANVTEASTLGSGFHISNYPLTRPERFDSQSLNGPLPPGWDVELYYNDGLVAWRQADSSGIYEFTDLPLEYGRNAFRLVFRGPQGQFRTEEQIFQVGDALVPAGELYYHVAAQPWADRGITSSAQLDWGLGSRLSLAGGVTLLHGDSAPFVSVGVRSAVAGSFVTADLLRAPTGDWAREFGLRTRVAGFGITATHKQLDGFRSDLYQRGNDLQSQSELRLSGGLPVFGARLPVDLEFRRDDRAGADNMQANLRLGAVYRGTAISNQLGWQSTGEQSELFGRLQFSRRFERFGLRAQITYGASGPDVIDDVSMTFDQRTGSGWLWSLGFDRSMVAQKSSLTASLNRSFESFSVGLQGGWSTDDVFAVGMNLFMSVGREPRTGTWKTGSAPTADSGAVSARVFLDGNLNGAFDGGEVLLSGVAFQVNGGRQQARTGESGIALLQRLPVNQFVDVGSRRARLKTLTGCRDRVPCASFRGRAWRLPWIFRLCRPLRLTACCTRTSKASGVPLRVAESSCVQPTARSSPARPRRAMAITCWKRCRRAHGNSW